MNMNVPMSIEVVAGILNRLHASLNMEDVRDEIVLAFARAMANGDCVIAHPSDDD